MHHAAKTIQHAWKSHSKTIQDKSADDPDDHNASPGKK